MINIVYNRIIWRIEMTFNENLIREAAYYNWQNAGCPFGQDEMFWNMAIEQIYGSKATKCCSTSCSKKKTASTAKKATTKTASKAKAKK
jgi:hypothetical protein